MSSSQGPSSTTEDNARPPGKIPAGLEMLFSLERDNVKTSLSALILAVHWSIVRAGLRLPLSSISGSSSGSTNEKQYTERLPTGWTEGTDKADSVVFTLDYGDPQNENVIYQLKVIEIVKEHTAVVTVSKTTSESGASGSEGGSSSDSDPKTAASTFHLSNFIHAKSVRTSGQETGAHDVYVKAEDLENQIWSELMEPVGLKVIGLPPIQGPYEDKVKTEGVRRQEEERQSVIVSSGERSNPLRDDRFPSRGPMSPFGPGGFRPSNPSTSPPGGFSPFGNPLGGLGRSDLDPTGRFGSGMIADPRGYRFPRPVGPGSRLPPGAVPPGARFDPFGPPNPNPAGPNPNWSVPNPDEPRPPGFDDMFM